MFSRQYSSFEDAYKPTKFDRNNLTIRNIQESNFLRVSKENPTNFVENVDRAMEKLGCESLLYKTYSSKDNLDRVQNSIKEEIFKQTKGRFKMAVDQDPNDLRQVMWTVYFENADSGKVIRETKRLNKLVLDRVLPKIISNIKSYYGYLDDSVGPRKILDRPISISNRRILPGITRY